MYRLNIIDWVIYSIIYRFMAVGRGAKRLILSVAKSIICKLFSIIHRTYVTRVTRVIYKLSGFLIIIFRIKKNFSKSLSKRLVTLVT